MVHYVRTQEEKEYISNQREKIETTKKEEKGNTDIFGIFCKNCHGNAASEARARLNDTCLSAKKHNTFRFFQNERAGLSDPAF